MRVLVTGGTGSLGRVLIRRLLALGAERVASLSRDEVKAAALGEEFGAHPALRVFVGDVRDRGRLIRAFSGMDTVVHAAALKRVDQGSYHPDEMLKTNVLGTQNVIEAAAEAGVRRVVVTSSDKASAAINCYGATKLVAEFLAVNSNSWSAPGGTLIACTRWGNVLGSRGSVVGVWRRRVREGKPLPLTDRRMTRFWLTLDEAAAFLIRCLPKMQGGEVFVPRLPSMRLVDLAEAVAPGHPIEVMGLRPGGEKVHESLMSDEEPCRTLAWPDGHGYTVTPSHRSWSVLPFEGELVPDGFAYRSDANERWLTVAEMREMLKGVDDD